MKRTLILPIIAMALSGFLPALAQPISQQPGAPATVAQVGSKLNISLYYSLPEDQSQVLQGFVQEFQQGHPFVNIQTKNFPDSAALYSALSTGKDLPSLAIMESSWLNSISQNSHLMPVEQWMPKDTFMFNWSVKCNCYVPLWDTAHIGDNLMALPYFFTTRALILNNDLLANAGVKFPPATWEQVAADAKAIEKKGTGTGFSLSTFNQPEQNARDFQLLAWQAGAPGLNNTQPELNQDAYQQVVQTLQTMKNALLPVDAVASDPKPVGITIGTVADYLQERKQGLPVRSSLIPGFDKSNRLTEAQCWNVGMFDNVPKPELYKVQEFAFFMLDFAQQRRWAEQTPYLAAHVKVFENPFYRQARLSEHNSLRVFLNALGKSKVVDTTANADSLYGTVGKNLGEVIKGERPLSTLTTN